MLNDIKFNIHSINVCTEVEGPFRRLAIWFQGCNIGCVGCCNVEIQEFKKNNILSLKEILKIVKDSKEKYDIEGITLLGGEPTLQMGLSLLCSELMRLNIGIILLSGLYVKDIDKNLINNVDLIIDGPFDINKIDTDRNMIGSINQNIIQVSIRYNDQIEWFYKNRGRKVEINIYNEIYMNGDVF